MTSYQYLSPKDLHLLSTLAQLTSQQASGCLHVSDRTQDWILFLERGKLVYASTSANPFGRLDRHLRRLSSQNPSLVSPVRVQVRLLFEKPMNDIEHACNDYEAICWLVEQQYLMRDQAGELISELAKELLETLLPVKYGSSHWLSEDRLGKLPRLCHLDLRSLIESCQIKPHRAQVVGPRSSPTVTLPTPSHQPRLRETVPQSPSTNWAYSPGLASSATEVDGSTMLVGRGSLPLAKTTYTVACIDDSPTVLSAIESYLDDQAFQVLRIGHPVSALMQVIRNRPDLILLDVTMPNLDGYELCSLLRRHVAFKQTPIIMVTSNRGFIDRAKAKLVGASGYLTKPFTQPELLKVIFQHLS